VYIEVQRAANSKEILKKKNRISCVGIVTSDIKPYYKAIVIISHAQWNHARLEEADGIEISSTLLSSPLCILIHLITICWAHSAWSEYMPEIQQWATQVVLILTGHTVSGEDRYLKSNTGWVSITQKFKTQNFLSADMVPQVENSRHDLMWWVAVIMQVY
jgi:hypothetical protein